MVKNAIIVLLACSSAVLGALAYKRSPGGTEASTHDTATAAESYAASWETSSTGAYKDKTAAGARPADRDGPAADQGTADSAKERLPSPDDPVVAELTTLRSENQRLEELVRNLQSEVSILNARRTPAPTAADPTPGLPQAMQRIISELLGNPETVEMAMDLIKSDQSRRFASLIALSGLDDAGKAQLRDLLADRYATRLDVAAVGVDALAPERRQQLDAEFRARLEGLVGADTAALFEKAEGKPVSFARMQSFDERLRYEATPLSREQYLPLWELMSSHVAYIQPPRTEQDFQSLLQRQEANAASIVQQAGSMLSAEQLRSLDAMLQDDLAQARVRTHAMIQAFRARNTQP